MTEAADMSAQSLRAIISSYRVTPQTLENYGLGSAFVDSPGRNDFSPLGHKLNLIASLFELNAGKRLTPHRHGYLEIVFCLSGEVQHQLDGKSYTTKPGDIYFLNNEIVHAMKAGREKASFLFFCFLPEYLGKVIPLSQVRECMHFFLIEPFFREEDKFGHRLHLEGGAFARLLNLSLLIVDCFGASFPRKNPVVHELFSVLFSLIEEEYRASFAASKALHESRETLFWSILKQIEEMLGQEFSIAELARSIGVNRTKLAETFKQNQGETIVSYTNRRRIEIATRLLTETELPIAEIALEVGFNDLSNFFRSFRKVTGLSPKQCRTATQQSRG